MGLFRMIRQAIAQPPKFNRYRLMLMAYLLYNVLIAFSIYTYTSPLFTYARDLGATTMTISVIGAVYGLAQTLLRVPLGFLSDLAKKRKIFLILGGLCSAVSGVGLCFFSTPKWLILWRALAGAAIATWVISTVLYTYYFLPASRPGALGLLSASNSTGMLAGMLLGGLATRHWGYHSSFLLAAIGGCIAFLLSFTIREVPPKNKTTSFKQLFRVAKNPLLLGVSFLALVITLVSFGTVFGFTPTFATDTFGCDGYQLGLLGAVSVFGLICANLILSNSYVLRKIGVREFVIMGFAISAACTLSIPLSPNLAMLFITQFIGGIGQGFVNNSLLVMSIYKTPSAMRTSAMGVYQSIYGLGIVFGPVVVGVLKEVFGSLNAGFYTLAALAGICCVLSFCLPKFRNA